MEENLICLANWETVNFEVYLTSTFTSYNIQLCMDKQPHFVNMGKPGIDQANSSDWL